MSDLGMLVSLLSATIFGMLAGYGICLATKRPHYQPYAQRSHAIKGLPWVSRYEEVSIEELKRRYPESRSLARNGRC